MCSRMVRFKMTEITEVGKWVGHLKLLYIAGGNVKYYSNLRHRSAVCIKRNISTETLHVALHSGDMKTYPKTA